MADEKNKKPPFHEILLERAIKQQKALAEAVEKKDEIMIVACAAILTFVCVSFAEAHVPEDARDKIATVLEGFENSDVDKLSDDNEFMESYLVARDEAIKALKGE